MHYELSKADLQILLEGGTLVKHYYAGSLFRSISFSLKKETEVKT